MNEKYVKISGVGNSIGIVFNNPIQLINSRDVLGTSKYTKIGFYHWNQDIVDTPLSDFDFSDDDNISSNSRKTRMVKESSIDEESSKSKPVKNSDVKEAISTFSKKLDLTAESTKKIEKNIVASTEIQNKHLNDIKSNLKISKIYSEISTQEYREIHCNIVEPSYHASKYNQFGDLIECDDQLLAISKPNSNVPTPLFMPILEGIREIKNISIEIKDCVDIIEPNGIPQLSVNTQNVMNTIVLVLK